MSNLRVSFAYARKKKAHHHVERYFYFLLLISVHKINTRKLLPISKLSHSITTHPIDLSTIFNLVFHLVFPSLTGSSKARRASQTVKMNGAFSAAVDSPRPSLLMGNQGGKAILGLSRPFSILGEERPQNERVRPNTFRDWPPCPPIQRGRRGTVKAGRQPIHFSLDGFLPSCYFSRSVATHLVTVSRALGLFCPIGRGRRTRDGAFIIRPVCC